MEPGEKPKFKKVIVSDFTPEVLAERHFSNLRGLGVYSDEINQWLKNFNRYTTGSAQEFWLSIFSGTQISIDRKSQEPILIADPFVSVCGGMQPGILQELAKDSRNENGFIDRLLFAFPDNLKKEIWSETELPERIITKWKLIVNRLLELPLFFNDNDELAPTILEFSSSAKVELKRWQANNVEQINATTNDALAGIYSKLEIYVIRLALIVELLKRAAEPQSNPTKFISVQSVEAAIRLTEYFRKTAKKVNSILNNSPVESLDQRKRAIYEALGETFSTNEAVNIAQRMDYSERAVKDFLNDRTFFAKIKYGNYKKII